MAFFCIGKCLLSGREPDAFKGMVDMAFCLCPLANLCFRNLHEDLTEAFKTNSISVETFTPDPWEDMAKELRERHIDEPWGMSERINGTKSKRELKTGEDKKLKVRAKLREKYGMSVGMDDKMVKKKLSDATELAWAAFFKDSRLVTKWMGPALANACCCCFKDCTQLRRKVTTGEAYEVGPFGPFFTDCCGGSKVGADAAGSDEPQKGHNDELLVVMSCPGDHHPWLKTSEDWSRQHKKNLAYALGLKETKDKVQVKGVKCKVCRRMLTGMKDMELVEMFKNARKLQDEFKTAEEQQDHSKAARLKAEMDLLLPTKYENVLEYLCESDELVDRPGTGEAPGMVHTTFEKWAEQKYSDGKIVFCPIQMCQCRGYGKRGLAVQQDGSRDPGLAGLDLWKAYWLSEVKRGIASQYSDSVVKRMRLVAIVGGGPGASFERKRLRETIGVLEKRVKLKGVIDEAVSGMVCCLTCGTKDLCYGGVDSAVFLAEAGARRVGFCMPIKTVDIELAYMLPEDLAMYLDRQVTWDQVCEKYGAGLLTASKASEVKEQFMERCRRRKVKPVELHTQLTSVHLARERMAKWMQKIDQMDDEVCDVGGMDKEDKSAKIASLMADVSMLGTSSRSKGWVPS